MIRIIAIINFPKEWSALDSNKDRCIHNEFIMKIPRTVNKVGVLM